MFIKFCRISIRYLIGYFVFPTISFHKMKLLCFLNGKTIIDSPFKKEDLSDVAAIEEVFERLDAHQFCPLQFQSPFSYSPDHQPANALPFARSSSTHIIKVHLSYRCSTLNIAHALSDIAFTYKAPLLSK